MTEMRKIVHGILDQNYEVLPGKTDASLVAHRATWRTDAPLPPDLLCLCLEYIITEEKKYHSNGTLMSHVFCVNDQRHGEYKSFYINGNPEEEKLYMYGVLHGECKDWYSNTKELGENGFYVNGEKHGQWNYWDDGALWAIVCYKHGKLHGEYKQWYSSGQIRLHGAYVDGKEHGEWKDWHNNGNLSSYKFYTNGKLCGKRKDYLPNGELLV